MLLIELEEAAQDGGDLRDEAAHQAQRLVQLRYQPEVLVSASFPRTVNLKRRVVVVDIRAKKAKKNDKSLKYS